ncbi:hypothetical protein EDWATA_01926 [Edwardsiella tarda ATCC 23685]|uniref:Uncharacterized protein n=1 Tax=Edwardsiella tarda ATCC 23685 TaxID=500638 RepID=D4F598_EDWTA|nr:hypothetical protein EDWATA_01926 [Edwardsiella tarda ATCC 23685]
MTSLPLSASGECQSVKRLGNYQVKITISLAFIPSQGHMII